MAELARRGAAVLAVVGLIIAIIAGGARWVSGHPDRVRTWLRQQLDRPWIAAVRHRYRAQLDFLLRRVSAEEAFGLWLTVGLLVLVACGWAFGEVLDAVLERDDLAALDSPVTAWLVARRVPWLTTVILGITQLGGLWVLAPLLTIVGLVELRRTHRADGPVLLALSTLGTAALVAAVKLLIARPRPRVGAIIATYGGFAFPSGHSAQAVAAYGALAFLVARSVRTWRHRVLAWAVTAVIAVLIGFSRLYLGAHWLSDVLGGFALGGAWLSMVATALTTYRRRRAGARRSAG